MSFLSYLIIAFILFAITLATLTIASRKTLNEQTEDDRIPFFLFLAGISTAVAATWPISFVPVVATVSIYKAIVRGK